MKALNSESCRCLKDPTLWVIIAHPFPPLYPCGNVLGIPNFMGQIIVSLD